ncbi:MAG: fibronectin type III domain-containing protein [Actinomycetota bacterium]
MRSPLKLRQPERRAGRAWMVAAALAAVALVGVPAVSQVPVPAAPYPASLAHQPTPVPDRIMLTWSDEPAHTQAVSWRTSSNVATPQAQIALAGVNANFTADAETLTATLSTPVQADLGFPNLFHSVEFTDLEPETKYLYRVGDGANWSEWLEFTTSSEDPEPFSFIYFGDAQNDLHQHWSRVIRRAYSDRPEAEFIVHAGDLVNTSTSDKEWGEWFWAGGWIDGMVPSIATPGNHEYAGALLSPYWNAQFAFPDNGPQGTGALYEAMKGTVYYVDYQGVRIVSLNSNSAGAAGQTAAWYEVQAQWLDEVLTNNPNRWTVVTFHHPVFSTAEGRDNPALRAAWRPILQKHDVDLVLQGHDHSYGRGNMATGVSTASDGTVYVVSVSGPKMYEITGETWTANGAQAKRLIQDTQLYQLVDVFREQGPDGEPVDVLRYEARTAVGMPADAFEIRKRAGGEKKIVETEGLLDHEHEHAHAH